MSNPVVIRRATADLRPAYRDLQTGTTAFNDTVQVTRDAPAGSLQADGRSGISVAFFGEGANNSTFNFAVLAGYRIRPDVSPQLKPTNAEAARIGLVRWLPVATGDGELGAVTGVDGTFIDSGLRFADVLNLDDAPEYASFIQGRYRSNEPTVYTEEGTIAELGISDAGDIAYIRVVLWLGTASGINALVGVGT